MKKALAQFCSQLRQEEAKGPINNPPCLKARKLLSEEFKIPDNIKIGKVDILFCHPGAAEAILSDDSGRELLKMTKKMLKQL